MSANGPPVAPLTRVFNLVLSGERGDPFPSFRLPPLRPGSWGVLRAGHRAAARPEQRRTVTRRPARSVHDWRLRHVEHPCQPLEHRGILTRLLHAGRASDTQGVSLVRRERPGAHDDGRNRREPRLAQLHLPESPTVRPRQPETQKNRVDALAGEERLQRFATIWCEQHRVASVTKQACQVLPRRGRAIDNQDSRPTCGLEWQRCGGRQRRRQSHKMIRHGARHDEAPSVAYPPNHHGKGQLGNSLIATTRARAVRTCPTG
jgi:hypothetical protein